MSINAPALGSDHRTFELLLKEHFPSRTQHPNANNYKFPLYFFTRYN